MPGLDILWAGVTVGRGGGVEGQVPGASWCGREELRQSWGVCLLSGRGGFGVGNPGHGAPHNTSLPAT